MSEETALPMWPLSEFTDSCAANGWIIERTTKQCYEPPRWIEHVAGGQRVVFHLLADATYAAHASHERVAGAKLIIEQRWAA